MKKVFLFAVLAAMASCSSDDDSTQVAIPAGTPMVTKVTMDGADGDNNDRVYQITYDADKRIKDVTVTGDVNKQMHFTYTGDGLISTVAVEGEGAGLVALDYDPFMRLQTFSFNGNVINVIYDAVTDSYKLASIDYSLNEHNDLKTFETAQMNYDFTKKGAFGNVNSNYSSGAAFFIDTLFFYCGAHFASNSWTVNNLPAIQFTNTYDGDRLVKTLISGQFNATVKFEYNFI